MKKSLRKHIAASIKDLRNVDKLLLFLLVVFSVFGLVMILSASSASTVLRYNTSSAHFFIRQVVALVGGFIAGFIIMLMPTRKHKFLVYLLTAIFIGALILVLVKGRITNNAQSWIDILGFSFQPSEFCKSILILFMAYFYNNLNRRKSKALSLFFIPLSVAVFMFALIAMQPDYGSALILLGIAVATFVSVPQVQANFTKMFKLGFVAILILGFFVISNWDSFISEERLSRFNFSNPCERYSEDSGYQVCNGFIAISNGGLWGVGLGKSSQKYMYLPESHTDFIFPIICEELGAVIGAVVILAYGVLLLKIYKIAREADNLRNSIIAYGTFWMLAFHIMVNLLGVLALIPLTGVPLPFLSYGGSFLLNCCVMLFFVARVSIENKKNKLSREIASLNS